MEEKEQLKFFLLFNQGLFCLGAWRDRKSDFCRAGFGKYLWHTSIPVLYRLCFALFSFPYGTRVGRFVRP